MSEARLQLSDKFSLPLAAALWTFAFLAIKGAGKTYDAAKLAEQMIKAGIPIVVLDPMGIWWGLRVGVKGDGLPVVIFGGDHADLPIPTTLSKDKRHQIIDEDKLRQAAVAILQAGLSVVFDTSVLSITQQTRAVAIFADELYRKNKTFGMRHVFIEEADVYCPQQPKGESEASKNAIDQLVRRGGNYNLGVTMITQRAAVLNKDVLSQTGCLFVLRIIWMKDKDTIRDWVKSAVKDEREMKKLAKWYDTLNELKNGEAWAYSPEHEIFEKVLFNERETLHASREYFLQETWEQKNITLRDVGDFVSRFRQKFEPPKKVSLDLPKVSTEIPASPQIGSFPHDVQSPISTVYKPKPPPSDDQVLRIQQTVPSLNVSQSLPNIVAQLEPVAMIGRICVVLKKFLTKPTEFSKKAVKDKLVDHSWDISNFDEAFSQLLQMEIVILNANNSYRVKSERIQILETNPVIEVH